MTQPPEVTYASKQFQEWLVDLKNRAMLGSPHGSYAMLRAVLHELRDRLSMNEALRFADVLPPLVRGIMLESWHPLEAAPATHASFFEAVEERLEPHHPPPDTIVEDVLAVLAHRTPPHLLGVISERMPAELEPKWRVALEGVGAS